MQKPLLTILLAACIAAGANAKFTAADAFKNAPLQVVPLIDFTKRAEMIQLYEANMADKAADNIMDGPTELLSLTDMALTLRHATDSELTVALLPMAKGDTAIMLLENLPTPAVDANVRVYTRDWKPLPGAYTEPTVADWSVKQTAEIPFMLAKGDWDSVSRTITLTPTINRWLGEDSTKVSIGKIRPSIQMKWDGKKFTIKK